jgi:hypothetical protein
MTTLEWANAMVWAGTIALAVVMAARIRQGVWRRFNNDDGGIVPPKPYPWVMPLAVVGVVLALGGVAILMRR